PNRQNRHHFNHALDTQRLESQATLESLSEEAGPPVSPSLSATSRPLSSGVVEGLNPRPRRTSKGSPRRSRSRAKRQRGFIWILNLLSQSRISFLPRNEG